MVSINSIACHVHVQAHRSNGNELCTCSDTMILMKFFFVDGNCKNDKPNQFYLDLCACAALCTHSYT